MKTFYLVIVALFLISLSRCKTDEPAPIPEITTTEVSNISYTTAKSGGDVISDGGSSVTARGVCWSVNPSPTVTDNKTLDGSGAGTFISSIEGLSPNTSYFVRAYATNANGTSYGVSFSFTTQKSELAQITTKNISDITMTSAKSGGDIISDGGASVTSKGVCWNTTGNPTISDSKTNEGSGVGTFTSSITGLTTGTLYHVRAYATNSVGTSYGSTTTFTTPSMPTLTTNTPQIISISSVRISGTLVSDGNGAVSTFGLCWGTNHNPTTSNNVVNSNSILLTSGIVLGTTYYVRAFASGIVGTVYADEASFTISIPAIIAGPTDNDGNSYSAVTIGTQTWMLENLKTTTYNDGTPIPLVTDNTAWNTLSTPAYCWYNNDQATYKNTYGALYNWYTVNTNKLCPLGWHVPSDFEITPTTVSEWQVLQDYLDGKEIAGGKMKESGTAHWQTPNTGATNQSKFTALPSAVRYNGDFNSIGNYGYWWSSTSNPSFSDYSFFRVLGYGNSELNRNHERNRQGMSVRCIKD